MQAMPTNALAPSRGASSLALAQLRPWLLFCILLSAVQYPRAVSATDDVANVSPCELESIINQLMNPNPEYQLHASALRSQLRNLLRDRQLAMGDEQSLNTDYDYFDEDKRSVAALAAQGLLHPKRSLATLAKNGQLPSSPDPEETDPSAPNEDKRYIGSLARSGGGGFLSYGKRNIGSLARDFQLPQNGKRNLATLARLGLLSSKADAPKRNLAAVARYNSRLATVAPSDKRNLGALKGSPVHGGLQQKRSDDDEVLLPASLVNSAMDYSDMVPNYWMYPSYADMDWGDFGRAQKRFLDTSKDPELFGIENALPLPEMEPVPPDDWEDDYAHSPPLVMPPAQKRHIGAVYRSGFLPSYRALRSTTGSYGGGGGGGGGGFGGGRFSRSGRARQFVEYYPQPERLRQPIAAVCKRCFLPYRPVVHWGAAAGLRGARIPKYVNEEDTSSSILTNALPSSSGRRPIAYASTSGGGGGLRGEAKTRNGARMRNFSHTWGTPPRITALHRRSFRRPDNDSMENYAH